METKPLTHVYTVSELTRNIRFVLEQNIGTVWVEGEVSNFTRHQSGHMYFRIRDSESVLSCVLFRRVNAELKFEIKNGMQVLCLGRISVYDKRGEYQLYVEKIEPKGAGALQIAFEQLKEKLRKEGLFEEARKRPIPYLPRRVGVVTSPTGAAIRDILNVLRRRFSNVEIILNPTQVQGDIAKYEIVSAIGLFNDLKNVDVIILARGGGSLEDLWPFNEEMVARAIYSSKIPVISAVGHEVDWTISDFVADLRAATPSSAAERVIPDKAELTSKITGFSWRLKNALLSQVDFLEEKLNTLKRSYAFREPLNLIQRYEQEVDGLAETLFSAGSLSLKFRSESLKRIAAKLDALSPLSILERGYSITMEEGTGRIVKNAGSVKRRGLIRTKLADGEIISRVEKTEAA